VSARGAPHSALPEAVREMLLAACFVPDAAHLRHNEAGVVAALLNTPHEGGLRFGTWRGPWNDRGCFPDRGPDEGVAIESAHVRSERFGVLRFGGRVVIEEELAFASAHEMHDVARQVLALTWMMHHLPEVVAFRSFTQRFVPNPRLAPFLPEGAFLLFPRSDEISPP